MRLTSVPPSWSPWGRIHGLFLAALCSLAVHGQDHAVLHNQTGATLYLHPEMGKPFPDVLTFSVTEEASLYDYFGVEAIRVDLSRNEPTVIGVPDGCSVKIQHYIVYEPSLLCRFHLGPSAGKASGPGIRTIVFTSDTFKEADGAWRDGAGWTLVDNPDAPEKDLFLLITGAHEAEVRSLHSFRLTTLFEDHFALR